ncbi:MAG: DUF805 domain-containing protein [Burkholderiales bacterium]|nr:DUF805 domain-containing protein [Burkholderiales bacterium]
MDDIQKAVKACFSKYADFNGRAARPEFWWFVLFQFVVVTVLGFVSDMLSGVASLGMLLPGLAVGARRLHDMGKSGWLLLLWLIPIIGWGLLIYWSAQPGDPAANAYGAPPSDAPPAVPLVPGQQ